MKSLKVEDIKEYKKNAKLHPAKQLLGLAKIVGEVGWRMPILVNRKNIVVAGHGRLKTYHRHATEFSLAMPWVMNDQGETILGEPEKKPMTAEQEKAYRIADNKLAESDVDMDILKEELADLTAKMFELTGYDPEIMEEPESKDEIKADLKEEFIIPPFSIWDTRQGYWQNRKRRWTALYGDSREGRDDNLLSGGLKTLSEKQGGNLTGTSEFDPVIAEICFRWFNTNKGRILDPFAGGIARGAVAGVLDCEYHGIDLSKKQLFANEKIAKDLKLNINYHYGNSKDLDKIVEGKFDLIFSCPPYYDLEKYNDGAGDISMAKTYDDFLEDYFLIIKKAVAKLKENRFAVFTVGNVRDGNGFYRNLVADTVTGFENAGAKFYNDIVLVNAVATASMRARRPFNASRKVAKVHQNILVFYKGDLAKTQDSFKELPQIHRYHENILVFYKGDINEIKENYKVVKQDLFLETED
jgi:16S rRNA G966 N2-methylase RsmD